MSDTGSGLPTAEEVENINNTGEAYVTRPTTQIDLERRQAIEDGEVDPNEDAGVARDFRVEGNKTDGYIGVSPEYKTYANDTEAPLLAEDGPEVRLEERAMDFEDTPRAGVTTAEDNPAEDPYPAGSTTSGPTEEGTTQPADPDADPNGGSTPAPSF